MTDEQLEAVLHKLRPRFNKTQPKINYVDHALRFWGVEAKFDEPDCLSGDLRKVLTDHRVFAERWEIRLARCWSSRTGCCRCEPSRRDGEPRGSHVGVVGRGGNAVGLRIGGARLMGADAGAWAVRSTSSRSTSRSMSGRTLAAALYAVDGQPWYAADGERMDFIGRA